MYKIPGIISKIQLQKKQLSSDEVVLVGEKLWSFRHLDALKESISAEKDTYNYIDNPYDDNTNNNNDHDNTTNNTTTNYSYTKYLIDKLNNKQYKHVIDSSCKLDNDNDNIYIDKDLERQINDKDNDEAKVLKGLDRLSLLV